MSLMGIPTAKDINVYDSLDEVAAVKNFLGKTRSEAAKLFGEHSTRYQEDLMWMGFVAFNFYIDSVDDYLISEVSRDDGDFIHALAGVFEFRLRHDKGGLDLAKMAKVVDRVVENFDKFDLDYEVFGDLRRRYFALRDRLSG